MSQNTGLRERIRTDFGVDLPLVGGQGLRADPYVMEVATAEAAASAYLQLLRCLMQGRRQAWRLLESEVRGEGAERSLCASIERIELHPEEVVTERAAYYFRFPRISDPLAVLTVGNPAGFVDPRSGLQLPFQLGWLHLENSVDNESTDPGMGWTVAYDAAGMKGTIYIYDSGVPLESDDVETARVAKHFAQVTEGAVAANPGATVKERLIFRDPARRGRCYLAILDLPGSSMTAVLLTLRNGCFVKMRTTFDATEKVIGRMAHESIDAFVDAVRPVVTANL